MVSVLQKSLPGYNRSIFKNATGKWKQSFIITIATAEKNCFLCHTDECDQKNRVIPVEKHSFNPEKSGIILA